MSLNKGGSTSKVTVSKYLVWPPGALSTTVHLLLMDCTIFYSSCCEMFPHSSTKAPASSLTFLGGMALGLTLRSNRPQTCSMGLRSGLFAGHGRTLTFLSCRKSRTEEQYGWWHCHAGGLCQDEPAGRVPHKGGGCLPCNAQRFPALTTSSLR